nr:serine hydrolase domain-containing protein [Pedobacter sp. ASV19]
MKENRLNFLILLAVIFTGCGKNNSYSQDSYKGGNKHAPVDISSFPVAEGAYDINSRISGPLKDSLDKTLKKVFDLTGMSGISAAMLVPGKGIWQIDTGFLSKQEGKKVDSTSVFYWASVSKLLTATVIDQLITAQKLRGDSKLSEWFPQFQNASKITIDELLMHTSGIYSFNNDPNTFSVTRYYNPSELIELSLSRKNLFSPGTYWSYSNTGYLLLALIAEKVEGISFAKIIEQRISRPLHLTSLRVLDPGEKPVNLALAHENGQIAAEAYSVPLGAGNIISNAREMVIILYALLTGKLGPAAQVYSRFNDLYPMFDKGSYYGKGVMVTDFSELTGEKKLWIGHSGGTQTYRALVVYDVATKAFVAVSINQHVSVEAVARKLLEQIKP